jgi:hypothetical protein
LRIPELASEGPQTLVALPIDVITSAFANILLESSYATHVVFALQVLADTAAIEGPVLVGTCLAGVPASTARISQLGGEVGRQAVGHH